MPIHILSTEVSSKIAAGEVIERPASLVKELVENSIDAGATQIIIEARGGGIKYIRVSDNGTGITTVDTQQIFQRYATSKISNAADLETIQTLGFRGEALHSIAAVSEVQIITCAVNEEAGSHLLVKNGIIIERGNHSCPQGTIVTVRELFHRVPARLKFLKSPVTENEHILDVVSRISLAFPEIRFTLFLDDRAVWRTSGNGNLRDVIISLYGLETAKAMLEVVTNQSDDKKNTQLQPIVAGLISPSEISRASRRYTNFFVNRRSIRSALLTRAVEEGYRGFLMTGRYPLAVISVSVPQEAIDVNVHPTKSEVRFSNEPAIFSAVQKAVHQTLIESGQVKVSDITQHDNFESPTQQNNSTYAMGNIPEIPFSPEFLPRSERPGTVPILRVVGQIANCYIIAEGKDGLYLIDQHAAHERVIFEKIMKERQQKNMEIQGLLEPITFEFNAQQEILFKRYQEMFLLFGFTIEPFGKRSYLVRAIPVTLQQTEATQVIREVLDLLDDNTSLKKREEQIAISIACHGVVRAGQVLSQEEMKNLVRQLERTEIPRTCPHGRPTMIHISSLQLAKEFGRSTFNSH